MENIQNQLLFRKIKQLSNNKKFMIIELTQKDCLDISSLSKKVKIAFNKCSNYCTQLEKEGLIKKYKKGKNTFVKSAVCIAGNLIKFE